MATTTPNYGWAVPTSTDLVKDGATAIETLGDAIDASMNTALGTKKAGMVLLNTTSFSAVNSVSLPTNTFSSTYTHYKTILEITTSSTNDYVGSRYRAAGSDISTGAYQSSFLNVRMAAATSGIDVSGANATTFTRMGYHLLGQACYLETTWFSPNQAVSKGFVGQFLQIGTDAGEHYITGGNFDTTTVADSVSFFPISGTFSGTLYCYGINK